mgnify:CR=1 FL=1
MTICPVNGLELHKGDTVSPLSDNMSGRISDIRSEGDMGFICVRPTHKPYSKGVWYAADRVQRLQLAKPRKRRKDDSDRSGNGNGRKTASASK